MPSPRREPGLSLFVHRVGDDDPRRCTGRRLLQRGLASPPPARLPDGERIVLLDPYANAPAAPADREREGLVGILAVDCSWNRLSDAGGFPRALLGRSVRRRLPWLLAANPQHFGRPTELNTVEALAAALVLFGERPRAARLLEGFPGGPGFLPLNDALLGDYVAAGTADAVVVAEHRRFGGVTAARTPAPRSTGARSGPRPSTPGP